MAFKFEDPDRRDWISIDMGGQRVTESGQRQAPGDLGQTVPLGRPVSSGKHHLQLHIKRGTCKRGTSYEEYVGVITDECLQSHVGALGTGDEKEGRMIDMLETWCLNANGEPWDKQRQQGDKNTWNRLKLWDKGLTLCLDCDEGKLKITVGEGEYYVFEDLPRGVPLRFAVTLRPNTMFQIVSFTLPYLKLEGTWWNKGMGTLEMMDRNFKAVVDKFKEHGVAFNLPYEKLEGTWCKDGSSNNGIMGTLEKIDQNFAAIVPRCSTLIRIPHPTTNGTWPSGRTLKMIDENFRAVVDAISELQLPWNALRQPGWSSLNALEAWANANAPDPELVVANQETLTTHVLTTLSKGQEQNLNDACLDEVVLAIRILKKAPAAVRAQRDLLLNLAEHSAYSKVAQAAAETFEDLPQIYDNEYEALVRIATSSQRDAPTRKCAIERLGTLGGLLGVKAMGSLQKIQCADAEQDVRIAAEAAKKKLHDNSFHDNYWKTTLEGLIREQPEAITLKSALDDLKPMPEFTNFPWADLDLKINEKRTKWSEENYKYLRDRDMNDSFMDRMLAIYVYTLDAVGGSNLKLFAIVMQVLHASIRSVDSIRPVMKYVTLLQRSVMQLPARFDYSGIGLRGVKFAWPFFDKYFFEGRSIVFYEHKSFTSNESLMESNIFCGNFGDRTIFKVTNFMGKKIGDFSAFPAECEIMTSCAFPMFEILRDEHKPRKGDMNYGNPFDHADLVTMSMLS